MAIRETVYEELSKINFSWFDTQKKRFQSDKYYDEEKNKIIIVTEMHHPIAEHDEVISYEFTKDTEIIPLSYFCWLDERRREYMEANRNFDYYDPIDAIDICSKLLRYTQSLLNDNDVQNYKLISAIVNNLEEYVEDEKKRNYESDYLSFLDFFLLNCTKRIWQKFELVEERYIIYGGSDYLNFTLLQNDLVGLLYLIWHSGFIERKNRNDISKFYAFCETHFKCQKRSGDDYETIRSRGMKNIFSKIDNFEITPQNDVFERLKKAFKDYPAK